MKKFKKLLLKIIIGLTALYLVLLIPDGADNTINLPTGKKPFEWNRDSVWQQLENTFKLAKQLKPEELSVVMQHLQDSFHNQFNAVNDIAVPFNDERLTKLENTFFNAAPYVAAGTNTIDWYLHQSNLLRAYIKHQSINWNIKDTAVKNALYKLLYGIRAATEEVILQTGVSYDAAPAIEIQAEKSATPYTTLFGVQLHSGDILVSRGGAAVSALISRGNDYPGNFSHVALLYVDAKTNTPYVIEAHIEKGVAIATMEQYLADKKLRVMVLRPSYDLPAIQKDSLLPHKAASAMYIAAQQRHIPYDFKMNFFDSTALFCSEVASNAYQKQNVQLWQNMSTISSQGVVNWLHDFGVENFVTQMPSDLEYDPQLSVVAEWRDVETLYKDHIDNAVTDALLEKANSGATIGYNQWLLPFIRVLKGWCWIKNQFGKVGMIPEGMSATRALKNETYVSMYNRVRNKTIQLADEFVSEKKYKPPYWQLVKFATVAAK
jgi:Permuted papain-like amidase enzyme, YaeF/YiiX, C92 family